MKKLILPIFAVATLALVSCEEDKKDDKEESEDTPKKNESFESACECLYALDEVADLMMELDEDEAAYKEASAKLDEIGKTCASKFDRSEAEACDNYEAVSEKIKQVR